jgi:hypothetical protein
MFPHCNIHKLSWIASDGRTHNQIDHILIDRKQRSTTPDAWLLRGADYDTDRYLAEAFRERLAVSKQTTHKFQMARFNPKKWNEVEHKAHY